MKRIPLVAVFLAKGKSVLAEVRKPTDSFGAGETWIPGGHVENGETSDEAIQRECGEEFGIRITEFRKLCKLPWQRGGKKYSVQYYSCKKWKGKIRNREAAKLIRIARNEMEKLIGVDRKAFMKLIATEKQFSLKAV